MTLIVNTVGDHDMGIQTARQFVLVARRAAARINDVGAIVTGCRVIITYRYLCPAQRCATAGINIE